MDETPNWSVVFFLSTGIKLCAEKYIITRGEANLEVNQQCIYFVFNGELPWACNLKVIDFPSPSRTHCMQAIQCICIYLPFKKWISPLQIWCRVGVYGFNVVSVSGHRIPPHPPPSPTRSPFDNRLHPPTLGSGDVLLRQSYFFVTRLYLVYLFSFFDTDPHCVHGPTCPVSSCRSLRQCVLRRRPWVCRSWWEAGSGDPEEGKGVIKNTAYGAFFCLPGYLLR